MSDKVKLWADKIISRWIGDNSEYKEVAIKKLEHIVRCEAGHDCVKFECKWNHPACIPGTGGTHGVRGLILRFVVKGDKGAVQFVLLTDWVPQYATRSSLPLYVKEWKYKSSFDCYPIPIDLGYHSKVPMHDGQEPISKSCEFTGGACYYDGSSLNAAEAMYSLVNGGDKALWEFLEAYYEHVFYGGAFPDPKEYPAKLRD